MIQGIGFTNRTVCCGSEKIVSPVCESPIITGQSWIPTVGKESTVLLVGKNFTWVNDIEGATGSVLTDNLISLTLVPALENSLIRVISECGEERFVLKAEQKEGFYYTELFGHKKEGWGSSQHNTWEVIWDNQRTNNDFILPIRDADNSGMTNWQKLQVQKTGLYRLVYADYITTNVFEDGYVTILINDIPYRSEPISYSAQLNLNEIIALNKGYEVRIVISTMADVQRKTYVSFPRIVEGTNYQIVPQGEIGGKFRLEFLN